MPISQKLTVGLLLVAVLLLCGCKSMEVESHWAGESALETPITADGSNVDWGDIPTIFFEDQQAVLGIANDSDNLYLLMRFRDQKWARAIKMSGLKIYVDAKGGKSTDLCIQYIGGPDLAALQRDEMGRGRGGMERGEDIEKRMKTGMGDHREFVFADKENLLDVDLPTDGSRGPAVSFDTSMSFFTYEFSIPLAESEVRNYGLGVEPGQTIGIGAIWGDFDKGKMREWMRPSGGMGGGMPGGGGRGGGMGGGGGGRGGGGMGGQRPDMPEKQEIWFKTVLATGVETVTGE